MFSRDKNKLLMKAIDKDDLDKVKDLLKEGADPNYEYGKTTPLIDALLNKKYQIAETLLDSGADPNKKNKTCYRPMEFLYYGSDSIDILKLMLDKGADPNFNVGSGDFLKYRLENDDLEQVSLLLDYNVDITQSVYGYEKRSFIEQLAKMEKVDLLKKTIEKYSISNQELFKLFEVSLNNINQEVLVLILNQNIELEKINNIHMEKLLFRGNLEIKSEAIKSLAEKGFEFEPIFQHFLEEGYLNTLEKLSNIMELPKDILEEINKINELEALEHSLDNKTTVSKKISIKSDNLIVTKIFQFASEEILTVTRTSKKSDAVMDTNIKKFNDVSSKYEINQAYHDLIKLGGKSPTWKPTGIDKSNKSRMVKAI